MELNEVAILVNREDPVIISDFFPGGDKRMETGSEWKGKRSMGTAYLSFVGVERVAIELVVFGAKRKGP